MWGQIITSTESKNVFSEQLDIVAEMILLCEVVIMRSELFFYHYSLSPLCVCACSALERVNAPLATADFTLGLLVLGRVDLFMTGYHLTRTSCHSWCIVMTLPATS